MKMFWLGWQGINKNWLIQFWRHTIQDVISFQFLLPLLLPALKARKEEEEEEEGMEDLQRWAMEAI